MDPWAVKAIVFYCGYLEASDGKVDALSSI